MSPQGLERSLHTQSGEPPQAPFSRHPDSAVLYGRRCQIGIGNDLAASSYLAAEIGEDRPVSGPGRSGKAAGAARTTEQNSTASTGAVGS